jgi:hypothetical protein
MIFLATYNEVALNGGMSPVLDNEEGGDLGISSSSDSRSLNVVQKLRGEPIMKKKMYVLGVAALVAAMLALSGVAQSAMWVGAQLGGNFPMNPNINAEVGSFNGNFSGDTFKPSVIGGATLGYDFVNSGFGAYAWPDWMKYFSFAMDLTYNKLNAGGDQTWDMALRRLNPGTYAYGGGMSLKGYEVAWTFLFMAHYGFMPDSEVPSGRINPYIGVGPCLLWSGFENPMGSGGASAMNVALVVEPGIRWMALPNVSIDTAMRYRYAVPSYDVGSIPGVGTMTLSPTLHQLAFLVRANYHF